MLDPFGQLKSEGAVFGGLMEVRIGRSGDRIAPSSSEEGQEDNEKNEAEGAFYASGVDDLEQMRAGAQR